jgi:hypothetical protein
MGPPAKSGLGLGWGGALGGEERETVTIRAEPLHIVWAIFFFLQSSLHTFTAE